MKKRINPPFASISLVVILLLFSFVLNAQSSDVKLKADDPTLNSGLGYSVDIYGKYAVAGAYLEGSANIYYRQGNKWSQVQEISGFASECFGNAVAINKNKIIVGAMISDEKAVNAGAVYIYEKDNGGKWNKQSKITASDASIYEFFGFSVAIEDEFAFVGTIQDGTISGLSGSKGTGAVYVFYKNHFTGWSETQKITAPDATEADYFGYSIASSGNWLLIGAYAQDTDAEYSQNIHSAGAVYAYYKGNDGLWKFVQKIVASDRAFENYFGSAISLDGKTAVIGAHMNDAGGIKDAGAVYVFELNAESKWMEKQKIADADSKIKAHFGYSVAISEGELVAGACYRLDLKNEDSPYKGFVSHYKKNEKNIWERIEHLEQDDVMYDNWFGYAVGLYKGEYIIGAYKDGVEELQKSGAVYFSDACKKSFHTMEITSCTAYTMNGQIFDESGTYQIIMQNKAGCDSVITLVLEIPLVDTDVISEEGILFCVTEKASYQWINANSQLPISKQTKREFTPSKDGNYAVIITQKGCKDTSSVYTFFKVDMDIATKSAVNVFPNPVSDILNIQITTDSEIVSYTMFDLQGKMVHQQNGNGMKNFVLDVSGFPIGTYLLTIEAVEEKLTVKVVKN